MTKRASRRWSIPSVLIACLFSSSSFLNAQDYAHPTKMELPESSFERPDPKDFQVALGSGLVAYVVEDHTVPLVSLTAFIQAGTADDPKQGAAEVLAHVLKKIGSAGRTGEAFQHELEKMVADYRVEMGPEVTEISLNVPAEDAWTALALLADVLRQPSFSDKAIVTLKGWAKSESLSSDQAAAESVPVLYEGSLTDAMDRFEAMLFANHPYGARPTREDFDRLTLDDVRAFHKSYFVPGNVALAISGDFQATTARSKLFEYFGDWAAAEISEPRKVPNIVASNDRHVYTYSADKLQGWVVMGHDLPALPLRDEAPLQVMNYIIGGGHFDTRLFRETRDKRGLTNDDSGFLEPHWRGPGTYTFRTYGRPEVVPLLIELTLKEIDRIREEEVTDEELFVARNALADGDYQMWFENGRTTARTFAEEWLRYTNHEASRTYVDRVSSVTKEDVLSAARKYLHPERMQMVLLGPIDKVRNSAYPEGKMRLEDFGELVAGK